MDEKDLTQKLTNFQQDGLDYLYNLEPTQNNLFYVGEFNEGGTADKKKYEFESAKYRIQSIAFALPTFEFEELKQLKIQVFKSVQSTKEVTITWLDDVYKNVFRYHNEWQNCWYNRKYDCMVRGAKGKFRQCKVYLFHFKDGQDGESSPLLATPTVELLATITLGGLVPKSLGEFKLEMGSSGANNAMSISYIVNKVSIEWAKGLKSIEDRVGDSQLKKVDNIGFNDKYKATRYF